MGNLSVLQELEDLRHLLDARSPKYRPPAKSASLVTPNAPRAYNAHLSVAEQNVDRLGQAIEAAEEEMEAALRRTTEVHKSQLRQRETELAETQRLLAAKETSVDSLRDTLATTKRSYEARLMQLESQLSMQESQIIALREELAVAVTEREGLQDQLHKALASSSREVAGLRAREAEAVAAKQQLEQEVANAVAMLQAERQEAGSAQQQVAQLSRQVEVLGNELRVLRVESRADKERLEAEAADLRRSVRAERTVRKACEKWLRTELQSRDEMGVLLTAIKESSGHAQGGVRPGSLSPNTTAAQHASAASGVQQLLTHMRSASPPLLSPRKASPADARPPDLQQWADAQVKVQVQARPRMGSLAPALKRMNGEEGGGEAAAAHATHQQVVELQALGSKVMEDNRRLQAELAAARKLLTERLVAR
ncbi:basal body protein [Haematococcus lacustris]